MGNQTNLRTPMERWQDGVSIAVGNSKWSTYDCDIRRSVGEVNLHLKGTRDFKPLDWQLIKAMTWVETGAESPDWKGRPMQIGVPGDPGLASLLSGKEGGDLILPPEWKARLSAPLARLVPSQNIRAGIAYLLLRMAYFDYQSVVDETAEPFEVKAKPGDSLEKIAKANGSTTDILRKMNLTVTTLHTGQVIKCQKGALRRIIVGWRRFTTQTVAQRYNGGGDVNYASKLDYALGLVRYGRSRSCE